MRHTIIHTLFIGTLLFSQVSMAGASTLLQQDSATRILETMTPEERIGQLFVITFTGNTSIEIIDVLELIKEHHISGVVLSSNFDNFVDAPDTIAKTYDLIATLQNAEYESSLEPSLIDQTSPTPKRPEYIPLIIAISQEGGGAPYSQILSGLSPTPSQMAIGATWEPEIAKAVGELVGYELQALGFNLLLGPCLDVLEDPRIIEPSGLGVRSFGGDPYWVSLMGEAYIEGIHEGSNGGLGVIAKHFPGIGAGDRPSSEEIPTVRKSISELSQIDLVPFFTVASEAPGNSPSIADGFLISNVRYQGFQGNIRATTRPVSLDREAYDQLMTLENLVEWREGGGLTMSDALGSRAIRRFVESLGQTYKGHLIAKDAFLAGNDLLYLTNIRSDDDPDEATTIRSTLAFFAQKYREDPVFAQRVDEAVLRILKYKLRIYKNDFRINRVITNPEEIENLGENQEVAIETVRKAATLISPSAIESENRIGSPPNLQERMVFFTDTRIVKQCTTCKTQLVMPISILQDEVSRLYGSGGAGQIGEWNLSSYTMADLANYLGMPQTDSNAPLFAQKEEVEQSLLSAEWLVFSILRSSPEVYGSDALKQLLDTRQDLFINKKIIVFSHDVPYDLDATDISKIDLYYALYSKPTAFIEYTARLLFKEATAEGHSPVSLPGVGYDLIEITSPDPQQIISLSIYTMDEGEIVQKEIFDVGDILHIDTNQIIDANGNQVPDGTPVEFIIDFTGENIPSLEISTTTLNGSGKATVTLDRPGILVVRAESSTARVSELVQFAVQGELIEQTAVAPEILETQEQESTMTAVSSPSPTEGIVNDAPPTDIETNDLGMEGLILGLLGVFITGGIAYTIASVQHSESPTRIRITIIAVIGSFIGYNYLAFGLPGTDELFIEIGKLASLFSAIAGGGILLIFALISLRAINWN
jgi:beta-N-acetylhexosaminidase